MYFVLSTQDTADFSLDKEILPEKFLMYITRKDFPLRVVSKMVVVRALIELGALAPDFPER